jgi:hypothetical protein
MAGQHISSLGVISSMSVGLVLGCAGLLGIEDATCDADFDDRCVGRAIPFLLPTGGSSGAAGSGGVDAAGAAGSGGVDAAGAAGTASVEAAGGTAGAGETGEAPAEPGPTLCETYCSTITAACTGSNEQYASPAACLAVCATLDPGVPGGAGNTVECRLGRAALARDSGEADSYCHLAGPGGGGFCGSDCNGYCTIMTATCDALGDYEACMPVCERVPNLAEPPSTTFYDTTMQAGDSLQCRLFHVTAATLDAFSHCDHAAGFAVCTAPP